MRKLTYIVAILAALYSGYWFIGASAVEKGAHTAISHLRSAGWSITYSGLKTRGFPSRFDTHMQNPDIAAPDGSMAWRGPFLESYALSYQPNKVIVAFPPEQRFTFHGQDMRITSDQMRASVAVKPNTDFTLDEATVEIDKAEIKLTLDINAAFNRLLVAVRSKDQPKQYDSYMAVTDITLPPRIRQILDPQGTRPAVVEQLIFDGVVTVDQTLDRNVTGPVLVDGISMKRGNITWGDMAISGEGEITIDTTGTPTGQVTLDLVNWDSMITMAIDLGLIDPEIASTLRNMATALAGGKTQLSLTLAFENGRTKVGPFPIGPAPKLR